MYTTSKPPTLVSLMHSALMKQATRRAPLKWSRDIWHWDLGSGSFWSCGVWEGRLRSGHGSVAYHECPVGMGFGKLPWAFCHVALSIPERYLWCVTMSRWMWFRVFLPFTDLLSIHFQFSVLQEHWTFLNRFNCSTIYSYNRANGLQSTAVWLLPVERLPPAKT